MKAVATGDEIAIEAHAFAVVAKRHEGPFGRHVVRLHVLRFLQQGGLAAIGGGVQILLDVGLAVGHEALAGVFPGVDEIAVAPGPGDRGAVVRMAIAVHAFTQAILAQYFHRALLEHAGANPRQHILAAPRLEYHAVDSRAMQDFREQHAGRSAADDRHLSFHCMPRLPPDG